MPAFIALLRGVNVGGAKRVPMAELRALLAGLGYTRIATLLASGNAVFHATDGSSKTHAQAITEGIAAKLGIEVPVVVKSAKELEAIVAANALADEAARPLIDPSRLLVAFAPDAATLARLAPIAQWVRSQERFLIGSQAAYLDCAGGILASKAAQALLGKAGGAVVTTRNWATTLKLLALAGEA